VPLGGPLDELLGDDGPGHAHGVGRVAVEGVVTTMTETRDGRGLVLVIAVVGLGHEAPGVIAVGIVVKEAVVTIDTMEKTKQIENQTKRKQPHLIFQLRIHKKADNISKALFGLPEKRVAK
jgi:hypothetical protein